MTQRPPRTRTIGPWTPLADFERLVRALRRSRGFSLYIALCNVPLFRADMVRQLKTMVGRPIVEITLRRECDPHEAVASARNEAPEDVILFIYGLEALLTSVDEKGAREVLSQLNWRRAAYRRLDRPLVFWLPEFAVPLLARNAPDFFDWNSGVYEFKVPEVARLSMLTETLNQLPGFRSAEEGKTRERMALLKGLGDEYSGKTPAERLAHARIALQLSQMHEQLAEYQAASEAAAAALELFSALGDERGAASVMRQAANIDIRVARYGEARGKVQEALRVSRGGSDRAGEAAALHQLGYLAARLG